MRRLVPCVAIAVVCAAGKASANESFEPPSSGAQTDWPDGPLPPAEVCSPSPCLNGGSCRSVTFPFASNTCDCVGGYSGIFCETQPPVCFGVTCHNGGSCIAEGWVSEVAACVCVEGFSGANCQHHDSESPFDVNPCMPNPCDNGGQCERFSLPDVHSTCTCARGFSGLTCQTVVGPNWDADWDSCDHDSDCFGTATCWDTSFPRVQFAPNQCVILAQGFEKGINSRAGCITGIIVSRTGVPVGTMDGKDNPAGAHDVWGNCIPGLCESWYDGCRACAPLQCMYNQQCENPTGTARCTSFNNLIGGAGTIASDDDGEGSDFDQKVAFAISDIWKYVALVAMVSLVALGVVSRGAGNQPEKRSRSTSSDNMEADLQPADMSDVGWPLPTSFDGVQKPAIRNKKRPKASAVPPAIFVSSDVEVDTSERSWQFAADSSDSFSESDSFEYDNTTDFLAAYDEWMGRPDEEDSSLDGSTTDDWRATSSDSGSAEQVEPQMQMPSRVGLDFDSTTTVRPDTAMSLRSDAAMSSRLPQLQYGNDRMSVTSNHQATRGYACAPCVAPDLSPKLLEPTAAAAGAAKKPTIGQVVDAAGVKTFWCPFSDCKYSSLKRRYVADHMRTHKKDDPAAKRHACSFPGCDYSAARLRYVSSAAAVSTVLVEFHVRSAECSGRCLAEGWRAHAAAHRAQAAQVHPPRLRLHRRRPRPPNPAHGGALGGQAAQVHIRQLQLRELQ